jgi:hypothetical protein
VPLSLYKAAPATASFFISTIGETGGFCGDLHLTAILLGAVVVAKFLKVLGQSLIRFKAEPS